MTHRLVDTPPWRHRLRHLGPRLALAALLCARLGTAEEPDPSAAPVAGQDAAGHGEKSALPKLPPKRPSGSSATQQTPDDYRWLAWTGIGAGSALLAASVWQWVVFANENSEAGDTCGARRGGLARCADDDAQARYLSARDNAKSARTIAAILGGLGAASVITSVLLFPEAKPGAGQASVAFSADPFAGDARASLSWTW